MCLALDSGDLWNCCTYPSVEGVLPTRAFGDTFCKCNFMSAIIHFNI